jgi:PIN domain nuclease of toxin-antitoxin system
VGRVVLDASALLAFVNNERGADVILDCLADAVISAVNFSEAVAKLVSRGATPELAIRLMRQTEVPVIAFDQSLAESAGALVTQTKPRGLSFADRACLALATRENVPALTADRVWAGLALGIEIRVIR